VDLQAKTIFYSGDGKGGIGMRLIIRER